MKKYLPYLPTVILLYFIGLLSFHTESIGAAIGLIVSALLFSYHHYMENIKNPALLEQLAKTEAKLETDYRVEIDKLREESLAKAEERRALKAKQDALEGEIFELNNDINILAKALVVSEARLNKK